MCGEVVYGDAPPASCPVCGVGPEQFIPVKAANTGFTSTAPLNVVVVGGGVLGLEAASEFVKTGRNVSVAEMAPMLMGRQMDETGSRFLKAAAEAKGVRVITGAKINGIEADGVQLETEKLPAQLVILSAGTKTNIQVLQSAGAFAERFVDVNEKMETTLADVYAAGDVAACNGVSVGIWNQAVEMGRVAGANAAGDSLVYKAITPAVSFTGFGIDLFAVGDNGKKEGEVYKSIEVDDPRTLTYRKYYFLHDVLVGAILVGDTFISAKVMEAYRSKADFETALAVIHGWK